MKKCNNKSASCVYVIDACESTNYLLLCSGTAILYYQEIDIFEFGMQERNLVDIQEVHIYMYVVTVHGNGQRQPEILAQVIFITYHIFFPLIRFWRKQEQSTERDERFQMAPFKKTEIKKLSQKPKFQNPVQIDTNLTIWAPIPLC